MTEILLKAPLNPTRSLTLKGKVTRIHLTTMHLLIFLAHSIISLSKPVEHTLTLKLFTLDAVQLSGGFHHQLITIPLLSAVSALALTKFIISVPTPVMNPRLALTLVVLCFLGTAIVETYDCDVAPVRRTCTSGSDKERFFFNTTSQRCDTYDWRTCTTGDNSFSDWDSCTHACVCTLPPASTACVSGPGVYHGNYFFNTDSNKCTTFPEGHEGCSENKNAFESESSCKMSCVCSMPRASGSCSGKDKAYYFNGASQRCEEFTYSGCGGNANRFASEEDCKEQCLCGLPPRIGSITCMAYMPRVFYNKTSQTCENFIYGGCAGTSNRFYSVDDCNAACP